MTQSVLAGMTYDVWSGDFNLIDPVGRPLDEQVAALSIEYASLDDTKRKSVRSPFSASEVNQLLAFSRRSAVFLVRDRDTTKLQLAINTISMVNPDVADFRDVMAAISLVYHAGGEIDCDVKPFFDRAAQLADLRIAESILSALRFPLRGFAAGSTGYKPIVFNNRFGLIKSLFKPYAPKSDLTRIAIEVSHYIQQDKYFVSDATIGHELPKTWLAGIDDIRLDVIRQSASACAGVHGMIRPETSADRKIHPLMTAQQLHCFLVETEVAADTDTLLRLSIAKSSQPGSRAMLSLANGKVFCLLIGRSVVQGREPIESHKSLRRFEPGLAAILKANGLAGTVQ